MVALCIPVQAIIYTIQILKRVLSSCVNLTELGFTFTIQTQSPDIEFFLCAPQCLSWSSPLSFALRCPFDGCSDDGFGGHAADMF